MELPFPVGTVLSCLRIITRKERCVTHDEILQLTPQFFAFAPIAGAMVVVIACIMQILRSHKLGHKVCVGTYVWPVVIFAVLIFTAIWCNMGLMDAPEPSWLLCTLIITLCGALMPLRDLVHRRLLDWDERGLPTRALALVLRVSRDAAVLLTASELARLALELPWNVAFAQLDAFEVGIEYTIIALAIGAAYFACMRRGGGPAIVVAICSAMGIVQHFVMRFKMSALLPSDILAIGTAAEVSGQFRFTLTESDLWGLTCACIAIMLLTLLIPSRIPLKSTRFLWRLAANVMLALFLALACDRWIEIVDYHDEDMGFEIDYWSSIDSYTRQGFLPSFLVTLRDMDVKAPWGYSDDTAKELIERYGAEADRIPERVASREASQAQFDATKPSIVVVMNETFADLSRMDGLACGYEGPTFFRNVPDALYRGELGVSVYGGGTCNSEFEALTANSQAFIGAGKIPYQLFGFDHSDNLARQLGALGYETTAIHPCPAENWNRKMVYHAMGFDKFLSLNDFPADAPYFHSGLTDAATYEQVLSQLRSSDKPQFIFDITIQNHSGYEQGNIPEEMLTDYHPEIDSELVSEKEVAELNEYLSCIQASDADLEWFLDELRNVGRPVVLLFFGDHHPWVSWVYNDVLFTEDPEIEHRERIYQTDYLIWANYQVAGVEQASGPMPLSADMLGSSLLDTIGAPLSDYQRAQIAVHTRIPAINAFGYRDTQGLWHEPDQFPELDPTYHDMAIMAYYRYLRDYS